MRPLFLTLFLLLSLFSSGASAKEYGHYDLTRLVVSTADTPSGKNYRLDLAFLDRIMADLSAHAQGYPPSFDTPQDQARAARDAEAISARLDVLVNTSSPSPKLLLRAALLNSIGHNLDVAGAAEKADANFRKLLALEPANPRGNYTYGTFLAGTGKWHEALPYLDKALSLGLDQAAYSIGLVHLALGDQKRALKNLQDYRRRKPDDKSVVPLIEAIQSGDLEIKTAAPAATPK